MSWWLTFPLSAFQNLPTTPYKLIYLKRPKEQYNFVYISVGSKNSTTLAHFIQSPRPMPRRKKCPRMNKESPNCQETSPRTILSSANRDHKEERHALKDGLPGHPKKKRTSTVGQPWEHGGWAILGEAITSVLNAHN